MTPQTGQQIITIQMKFGQYKSLFLLCAQVDVYQNILKLRF